MEHDYHTQVVCIKDLSNDTIHAMETLYLENFDSSSTAIFRNDLADKDEVILLYNSGALVGFTTLQYFEVEWSNRPANIVYSGDTIVSPQHWGQQALAFAWLSRIGELKKASPDIPLYWFLLVKGHRTFKYLSVFGKSFYPHWSEPRNDLKPLADKLAADKFGSDYDAESGIIKFPSSRGHLNKTIAYASPEEMRKDATRFFFEKNPGYLNGHELVCICELELFNMRPLAARIFQRAAEPACT